MVVSLGSARAADPSSPDEGDAEGATRPDPTIFPPCPGEVRVCARLRIWITSDPREHGADDTFLLEQLATANRLHAPAGLGFEVAAIEPLDATLAAIETRTDRDALGAERSQLAVAEPRPSAPRTPRVVDVFVVSRLANVDAPAETPTAQIRGVHWRLRRDRARRWIILSRISPPHVLAHELGHYFGLPHSNEPRSLMNTGPTALPSAERFFLPKEVAVITARAKRFLAEPAQKGRLR
jgi:hypothetical protein